MSLAALAQATRDRLQAVVLLNGNPIDRTVCECCFDGQPPPIMGQMFLAVHAFSWTPEVGDFDLWEAVQLAVTVTLRMGDVPLDRWGIGVWLRATTGLDAIVRNVVTAIHHNQALRAAANVYIGTSGNGPDGYFTPLRFMGGGNPKPQGAKWFLGNEAPTDEVQAAMCGVSQELRFGKAKRGQTIAGMT